MLFNAEIIVMSHGSVAERGSHAVLLEANGLYADMWRKQSAAHDEPE